MAERIGIYVLRIMRDDGPDYHYPEEIWDKQNEDAIENIGIALSKAEDAVNEALPAGCYCQIDDGPLNQP